MEEVCGEEGGVVMDRGGEERGDGGRASGMGRENRREWAEWGRTTAVR